MACGTNATGGGGSTAVGAEAGSSGANGGTFFGADAGAASNGSRNTALGNGAGGAVDGHNNLAVGADAGESVTGSGNTALGATAGQSLHGDNNIAIGNTAGAGNRVDPLVVSNTIAIGNNAVASANGAMAIGHNVQATRANQVVLGTTANTYTMAGITSAASKAAQSGPTQLVTSDSGGNLATTSVASLGLASSADVGAINSQLGAVNSQLGTVNSQFGAINSQLSTINSQLGAINARLDDLNGRTNKAINGVAMAFAMAGVPTLMPHERFAATMNWGTYQGANGLAVNTAFRITNNVQLNGGIGYGADERTVGGRIGLRVGW